MWAPPSTQRGGYVRVKNVASGLSALHKKFFHAVKNPLESFNALNAEQKSRMIHEVMAWGGACMFMVAPVFLASSGVGFEEFSESIKGLPTLSNLFNYEAALYDIFQPEMVEKIKSVAGTSLSGAFITVRNTVQMLAFSKHADLSSKAARQWTRAKESLSNTVSALTNVPQLIEGLAIPGLGQELAGGSAIVAYGIRGFVRYPLEFFGRLTKKDFHLKPHFLTHSLPGFLMVGRGGFQALCAASSIGTDPYAGAVWTASAAFQTLGGTMIYNRDQAGEHRPGTALG